MRREGKDMNTINERFTDELDIIIIIIIKKESAFFSSEYVKAWGCYNHFILEDTVLNYLYLHSILLYISKLSLINNLK